MMDKYITKYKKYKKYKKKYKSLVKYRKGGVNIPDKRQLILDCPKILDNCFLLNTLGFSQIVYDNRFITIIGENHHNNPSISKDEDIHITNEIDKECHSINDPQTTGYYTEVLEYVYNNMSNLECNKPKDPNKTLVLLEIAESLKDYVSPSYNLEAFRTHYNPHITCIASDIRREIFDLGRGDKESMLFYYNLIIGNEEAYSLTFDEFQRIMKKLTDFYNFMLENAPNESFRQYILNKKKNK
jgi:hypothetical protein